jgi:uncharacterized protein with GYD domain
MGAYDVVLLLDDAPDDETMTAFALRLGSLGNVKTQTMRAFPPRRDGRHSGESNSLLATL